MSMITITVKTNRKHYTTGVNITQIFEEKKLGSVRNVLKAALNWLVLGTEFEGQLNLNENDEGNVLCNWCGKLKPIEELREITDETEFVTWTGCRDCYKKKLRL